MIMSLTSMHISNASLLDEATVAAEAMVMAHVQSNQKKKTLFVDKAVLPQTISESVLKTRAKGFGINLFFSSVMWLTHSNSTCYALISALVSLSNTLT
jgi:glycine dehydrogenase